MAKAKKHKTNGVRAAILARTAAGIAEMERRAAGADISDLDHLPVIEIRPAITFTPPRSHHATSAPVDNRPPIAPPVCFEIDVSAITLKAMRGAAKRSGMSVDDFSDLAVRCMLDAAEADNMRAELLSSDAAADSAMLLGQG